MGKRERERKEEEGEEEDAASCLNSWLRRTGCHQVPQLFSFCCVGSPLKAKISGRYLNEHLCFPFRSLFICIKGECPAAYTECQRPGCQSARATEQQGARTRDPIGVQCSILHPCWTPSGWRVFAGVGAAAIISLKHQSLILLKTN